jgi:hypothetical protein
LAYCLKLVVKQYVEVAASESDELTNDGSDEIHAAWSWVSDNHTPI